MRLVKDYPLNERSVKNLAGVHPDLVKVVEAAALRCDVQIVVTEGLRSLERQKELVAAGKSWTLNGRHLTGHAVDLVDGDNYGYDIPDLDKIAKAMKSAADDCDVKIVWGGDWKTRDTPHFELCRKAYPASGVSIGTQVAETAGKIAASKPTIVTTALAAGEAVRQGAGSLMVSGVPAVPGVATKSLENVGAWKKLGGGVMEVGREAVGVVAMTGRLWPYVMVAGGAGLVLAFAIWKRHANS